MPLRIAGGNPHTFPHVNLHLHSYLVSLSSQMSSFPRLPRASLPFGTASKPSSHSGLLPPAFPLLLSLTQALLLLHSTRRSHAGSSELQSSIPTGTKLPRDCIPGSLPLGKMRIEGFLVPWTSHFFAFRLTIRHVRYSTTFSDTVQFCSTLASWSLNVGSLTEQWLFEGVKHFKELQQAKAAWTQYSTMLHDYIKAAGMKNWHLINNMRSPKWSHNTACKNVTLTRN